MENNNEVLLHYGVKGMKWGVRRSASELGNYIRKRKIAKKRQQALEKARETRAKNRAAEADRQKKLEAGRLSPKKMTDKELQARIDRLDLEKKYTDAIKSNRASQSRAKRFVDKFIDAAIDKTAENAAADIVAQAIKVVLTKGTNKVLEAGKFDPDIHTNNKKK